jgi:ARID/BRIGHT DNA binding domain
MSGVFLLQFGLCFCLEAANLAAPMSLQEILSRLPTGPAFTVLLTTFMRLKRGRFKIPVFSGQELDLHQVFMEVQLRGGYDHVTSTKMWKEICRMLRLDLKGQTSASYNMRINYEKCLLDFERYVTSGEYSVDLAAGRLTPSAATDAWIGQAALQGTCTAWAGSVSSAVPAVRAVC